MIYKLDRARAVAYILKIISEKDDNVLQNMYRHFKDAGAIPQEEILKLWHGFTSVDTLKDKEIEELLQFCLSTSASNEYQDFLIEVDTSPIKIKYIDSIKNKKTQYAVRQYLEVFTEKIESVYHKDLCQLSKKEALNGLSNLPNASVASLRQALTVARGYCNWCIENHEFDGQANNIFKRIKVGDIPLEPWIKDNVVKDANELMARIENTIPINQGFVAPVAAALAWMGFDIETSTQLKNADVNIFDRNINGKKIPQELLPVFVSYSNSSDTDLDDPYLKRKRKKDKKIPFRNVDISNIMKVFGSLNYGNIMLSSSLFALYEIEKKKGAVSQEDYVAIFGLNTSATSFLSYLKDKKRLYEAYKSVYWK